MTQAVPLLTYIRKISSQLLRDFTYPHGPNTGTVKVYLDHFILNPLCSLFTLTQLFRLVFYSDLLTPGWCGFRIPVQVRDYFHFKTFRLAVGSTLLLIQWVLVLFPGAKRPVCEADHQSLSGAEVKSKWSYNLRPLYLFMERKGKTLPLPLQIHVL